MILNMSHKVSQPDEGHSAIKLKLTKAAQLPGKALFDCYTYDPAGSSKIGSHGKVNAKFSVGFDFKLGQPRSTFKTATIIL